MQKILVFVFILIIFFLNGTLASDENKTSIRLHAFISEKNKNISFEINYNKKDSELKSQLSTICDLKKKILIKFIIHGFAETWNMSTRWNWVKVLKDELFKSEDSAKLCILIVDWRELARGGEIISNYWKAIFNMNIVADLLTKFLSFNTINQNNMHC